ncbi:SDR family oxidoreductase [Conexibacter sp. JD483]|uniref:SDR family oxidoreductase n=1 Tax=unclassified Conexibacter TaxID=2627773 RepID=UPI0027234723|nr:MULTISPECIES: SDR family oxidoreductase [unclassified Conexibacter]MDO8187664.1 SDR family oxidoreductase [Conexibacter sp. CPCC 205706]MDO8199849.1 SDR family oxidoreductase [Conexibacter sp. CPCC 205762]MDR9370226.1 SDR family oxidoreductase [Conexibacter sp. JD483]
MSVDPARLDGRTAIVCGASTGIGLGIAEALREAGAEVVMFAYDGEELRREAERIGGLAVVGDFTDEGDLRSLVETTLSRFGKIDILVHNGAGAPDATATATSAELLRLGLERMLLPTVALTQLALPHLKLSPAGRVIAITSTSVREPIPGMATSNAFRPAAAGWLKMLSTEVGGLGITVNSVGPGRIATRTLLSFYEGRSREQDLAEIPLRRFGTSREVGEVVRFLASDAGAYVNGAHIPVDGGLSREIS